MTSRANTHLRAAPVTGFFGSLKPEQLQSSYDSDPNS